MTKIGSNAALATAGSVSFDSSVVHEFLSITVGCADLGATGSIALVKAFMQAIVINTKLTGDNTDGANNTTLWDLAVASTDFHGCIRAQVNLATGANLEIKVPIIQSTGRILKDWQIDVTNNTGLTISVDVSGSSTGMSLDGVFFKYLPNTLSDGLSRFVTTTFTKVLVDYEFSKLMITINGTPEEMLVDEVEVMTNLNDEIFFVLEDTASDAREVLVASDSGYGIFDNDADCNITSFEIQRVASSGTVSYLTVVPVVVK